MRKNSKSLTLLLSVFMMFFALLSNPFETHAQVRFVPTAGVYINGKVVDGINPVTIDGEYYLPIIYISRILGHNHIIFEEKTKTYEITNGTAIVRVTMGGTRAKRGDEYINIKPARWVEADKTGYIPLDSVGILYNVDIHFEKSDGSIQITNPAKYHLVQKNDTLWRIAEAHHTTVDEVKRANNLQSNTIYIGQKIKLPPVQNMKELEPKNDNEKPNIIKKPPSTTQFVDNIITEARRYLGAKYKYGATLQEAPNLFDCSSFIQLVFLNNGIKIPRVSRDQATVGQAVTQLQKGDLMFFTTPALYSDGRVGHVGIYMGDGSMIHASESKGVIISENVLKNPYWSKNYLFSKRVIQ